MLFDTLWSYCYSDENLVNLALLFLFSTSQTQLFVQLVEKVDLPVGWFTVPGDPKMFVQILQSQVLDVIADSVTFLSNGGQLNLPDMVKKHSTHFLSYVVVISEFEIAESTMMISNSLSQICCRSSILSVPIGRLKF